VTPMHTLETIFEDPHLVATKFFEHEDHPTEAGWSICASRPNGPTPAKANRTPDFRRTYRRNPGRAGYGAEIAGMLAEARCWPPTRWKRKETSDGFPADRDQEAIRCITGICSNFDDAIG